MTHVPVFHARVSAEGRLEMLASEAWRRREYLHTLKGELVEVIVRKVRTQRSADQNAYLHAVPFPLIAEHTGYSIEEVKLVLMGECWGWHQVAGHEIPIKAHTADMTTEECTYFIEWLPPWALANLGCLIPLPGEVA
jgi:hypothetical protein